MSLSSKNSVVQVLGVALDGSTGSPVIVLFSSEIDSYLSLSVTPFDAEMLIQDFTGMGNCTGVAWMGRVLHDASPKECNLFQSDESNFVCFSGSKKYPDWKLAIGEGLSLARRMGLKIYADNVLFEKSGKEMEFLVQNQSFQNNFLYLTPPTYAPNISMI